MHLSPALKVAVEVLAPAHIDTLFHGRSVPTRLKERQLFIEAGMYPDLLATSSNYIHSLGSTGTSGPHKIGSHNGSTPRETM